VTVGGAALDGVMMLGGGTSGGAGVGAGGGCRVRPSPS
jgi:hypothetical protein